ncbi:MAG: hypothetical protein NPIRA02_38430 [Nitrospirales bacterium]|nr:MAG: hypothetical protein NPIRA02_38430 [Nitrospirales bacterium]
MPTAQHHEQPLWSVILTGDDHHTISPALHTQWLNNKKPTPYCTFVGTRSMLQHTWDRADQLSHPNSKITVVGKSHLHEACTQLGGRVPGIIITEPRHQGMVVSLFLALTYLQVKAPQSMVVAYPADHFVYPEDLFLQTVQRTIWATEDCADHIFILEAAGTNYQPSGCSVTLDQQLGWVHGTPIYGVQPPHYDLLDEEEHPLAQVHYLSNTSVLIAKSDVFWNLGWQYHPHMMEIFDELQDAIGTSYERTVLDKTFHSLKFWDTSLLALLQLTPNLAIVELEHIRWSHWGDPRHILEDVTGIGKKPTFPVEYEKIYKEESFTNNPSPTGGLTTSQKGV